MPRPSLSFPLLAVTDYKQREAGREPGNEARSVLAFFGCAEPALIESMFGVVLLHWLGFNTYMMHL